ncbi:MAG: hypothetical protein K0B87_04905 [Candidatus Syntrophosphaera sp.]|nr:hypothetical protein [Candidatus Syntrophosphaera sp.]
MFQVRKGSEPVHTPAGNPVITENEALAKRLAEHFEKYGESAEERRSIALFHFPRLDFVRQYPRQSLEQQLILGFDPYNDWTLRQQAEPEVFAQRRLKVFGNPELRRKEGRLWIEGLNLNRICAALVLGKATGSVNLAFLASRNKDPEYLQHLIKEVALFNHGLADDSLEELLANFLFYWEV